MHLYDKYKLTQLHIFRDTVSRSFDQQVLASYVPTAILEMQSQLTMSTDPSMRPRRSFSSFFTIRE